MILVAQSLKIMLELLGVLPKITSTAIETCRREQRDTLCFLCICSQQ